MSETRVKKIAVLGAESTGKTWLCERLAAHFETEWVPEYAREYFNGSDIYNYTLNDLITIARRQLEMEEEHLAKVNRLLFCDTTLITLKIWAELEFRICPQRILDGIAASHYDLYLVTANDIPWEQDPLRQNKHSRDLLLQLNLEEVKKTGKPYRLIEGTTEDRLRNAIRAIEIIFL